MNTITPSPDENEDYQKKKLRREKFREYYDSLSKEEKEHLRRSHAIFFSSELVNAANSFLTSVAPAISPEAVKAIRSSFAGVSPEAVKAIRSSFAAISPEAVKAANSSFVGISSELVKAANSFLTSVAPAISPEAAKAIRSSLFGVSPAISPEVIEAVNRLRKPLGADVWLSIDKQLPEPLFGAHQIHSPLNSNSENLIPLRDKPEINVIINIHCNHADIKPIINGYLDDVEKGILSSNEATELIMKLLENHDGNSEG